MNLIIAYAFSKTHNPKYSKSGYRKAYILENNLLHMFCLGYNLSQLLLWPYVIR